MQANWGWLLMAIGYRLSVVEPLVIVSGAQGANLEPFVILSGAPGASPGRSRRISLRRLGCASRQSTVLNPSIPKGILRSAQDDKMAHR